MKIIVYTHSLSRFYYMSYMHKTVVIRISEENIDHSLSISLLIGIVSKFLMRSKGLKFTKSRDLYASTMCIL